MLTGKQVVERLVTDVINGGRLELIDDVYAEALADRARDWIGAFRASFPDVHMEIVELIAEPAGADGEMTAVGRFACSGTHAGPWRGHRPTGRRFEQIKPAPRPQNAAGRKGKRAGKGWRGWRRWPARRAARCPP
jgi:predicted ester cyclase